jgi:hypothetical protein
MKTILQSLFVIVSAGAALAQTQIVVPGGLANTEGNSSSSDLFINGVGRMDQVYSASEFSSIAAPLLRIDGVAFRLESGSPNTLGLFTINVGIGTTSRSPDSLSPVFDENLGPDSIAVYLGNWGFASLDTTSSPRPFDLHIDFRVPFYYDPSKGNLTLSIVAGGSFTRLLDAQSVSGDGVGRVFGPNALSGTVDTLGLVTRFDITPVPEPSGVALFAVCAVVVLLVRFYSKHLHFRNGR